MKKLRLTTLVLGVLLSTSLAAEPLTLLETGNILRFIDTTAPSATIGTVPITGLQIGEAITAIDYRPATGVLYGVGVVTGGQSRLYTINTATGAATLVGGGPFDSFVGLTTTGGLGMDFNPVVDRIRLVNNLGTNMRVNPDTAAVTLDTSTAFAAGDPNQSDTNDPNSIAYSNNVAGAVSTTLYGIVLGSGPVVVTIGSPGGSPVSPNSGQMFTVGSTLTGGYSTLHQGLDISPSGVAYAVMDNNDTLYTINLATGAATAVGTLPSPAQGPMDIAAPGAAAVAAEQIPALDPRMLVVLALLLAVTGAVLMKR
jgi:hypothetical protein